MAMKAIAIRFEEEEKDWIQSYASVLGISFSEFVRSSFNPRALKFLTKNFQNSLCFGSSQLQ